MFTLVWLSSRVHHFGPISRQDGSIIAWGPLISVPSVMKAEPTRDWDCLTIVGEPEFTEGWVGVGVLLEDHPRHHIMGPFEDLGPDVVKVQRKESDAHRPRIMMRAGVSFWRKRAMAALDWRDFLLISWVEKPRVGMLPWVHVSRRNFRTKSTVTRAGSKSGVMVKHIRQASVGVCVGKQF
jgi:hypothetical protein